MKRIIQQKLQCLKQLCQPKISKHQSESGGSTKRDYFNLGTLFVLGLINILDQILKNQPIQDRLQFTIPFIIISILIFNKHTNKGIKALSFISFGIFYEITAIPDATYIGSSILFSLAYMQYPNVKFGVFVSLLSLVSILIKSTEASHTPSQLIAIISGFVFIYGNFYLEIQKWKDKIKYLNDYYINQISKLKEELKKALNGETEPIKNIDTINITQEEKAILHLYCEGYDYNRIQKTLGLNIAPNSVRRKITAIKKENKNKILNGKSKETNINDAQFGKWLYQKV